MSTSDRYVIALSVLFAGVFAMMIIATLQHRRACVRAASPLSGTHGLAQWLWMLLPLAILAFINFSLIQTNTDHRASPKPSQHAPR